MLRRPKGAALHERQHTKLPSDFQWDAHLFFFDA